jgi:tight adherence protein C
MQEKMQLMAMSVAVFLGISVTMYYIIAFVAWLRREKVNMGTVDSVLVQLLRPALEVLSPINSKLTLNGYRRRMNTKFHSSGGFNGMTVDIFLAFKEVCFVSGFLMALVGLRFRMSPGVVGLSLGFGLCASFLPELLLANFASNRKRKIIKELPYILDLLTVSVEAGLDFMRAIERVVKILKKGELVKELAIAHKSLEIGYSREAVLRQLDSRTEISDVKTVVSALIQADRLGTGISNALRAVAQQAREQRSQRAETMAGKATVKLIIPMVLVFVAVMLMIIGPVAIQIYQTVNR